MHVFTPDCSTSGNCSESSMHSSIVQAKSDSHDCWTNRDTSQLSVVKCQPKFLWILCWSPLIFKHDLRIKTMHEKMKDEKCCLAVVDLKKVRDALW